MKAALAVAGLVCLLVGSAAVARADNTTCAGAILVVPDGSTHDGELAPLHARWYRFVAKAGRSYAVMLENLTPSDQQGEIGVLGLWDGCGGPEMPGVNDYLDPQEPASADIPLGVGATRVAFRAQSDTSVFFNLSLLGANNGARFRVRVEETTLFNPTWSTSGGFDTYYRLYNTTNLPCAVTLDLRTDADALPAGGSGPVTFTLGANRSVTRHAGAGDLGLAAGQSGHATIAHLCTPGAIQVDAYLSAANGNRMLPVRVTSARQQR